MIAQARHHGIETLFMLTERRLAKQLSRLGVNVHKIGAPIEHRGIRYPSMMSVRKSSMASAFSCGRSSR